MSETRRCEWENCTEDATHRIRWRREALTLRDQARVEHDVAHYCPAHAQMAKAHGAAEAA